MVEAPGGCEARQAAVAQLGVQVIECLSEGLSSLTVQCTADLVRGAGVGGVLHGGRGAAVEGGVAAGRGPPAERLLPAPLAAGLNRVSSSGVVQGGWCSPGRPPPPGPLCGSRGRRCTQRGPGNAGPSGEPETDIIININSLLLQSLFWRLFPESAQEMTT